MTTYDEATDTRTTASFQLGGINKVSAEQS